MKRFQLQCTVKTLVLVAIVYVVIQATFWKTIIPDEKTTMLKKQTRGFHVSSSKVMNKMNETYPSTNAVHPMHTFRSSQINMSGLPITMQKLAQNNIIVRGLAVRSREYCGQSITTLAHHSVLMKGVIMDTNYIHKSRKAKVGKNELEIRRGFLMLNKRCNYKDYRDLISRKGRWVRNWNSYIVMSDGITYHKNPSMDTFEYAVVVPRFEYLNVYWTILDLYNVYLVLMLFETQPDKAAIIFADEHPRGQLDPLWSIFGTTLRITEMSKHRNFFRCLIWMAHREYNPIVQSKLPIPLFADFREFVYKRNGYMVQSKTRCIGALNIVLILRPDTAKSETRLRGSVRAILNSDAVINTAREIFPEHNIAGIRMDTVNISSQIKIVSTTDVLIGMHGAGLAFGALLRPGSAVIEIFPYRYRRDPNNHMEILAKGNGAFYLSWYNNVPLLEDKFDSIHLPIPAFLTLLRSTIHTICNG